ncbi:unnamed protein product [Ectocarpus sp. 6 AP-2014]
MCTFWCVIALGALAKGCPIESVRRWRHFSPSAQGEENAYRLPKGAIGCHFFCVPLETPTGGFCFLGPAC